MPHHNHTTNFAYHMQFREYDTGKGTHNFSLVFKYSHQMDNSFKKEHFSSSNANIGPMKVLI
jgi:hypothetical protein